MCHIYASTDPERYECVTKSVRLQGKVTSVRLENEFWEVLDQLAYDQHLSTGQFITKLYNEVLLSKGEVSNLTSLLRVACIVHLQQCAKPAARFA
ncbi:MULTISPECIES: ribbon-helix-helix domain-containing protein [Halomonadaceae]|jgi:predicted DNA-binding ribbon-helix-helix protein|uniref:ribbon-helix-helix domain-containing protein n=1 Tax=Halomonadaceae TaxID=28256 RepID=UPI000C343892|nr:MULTISPECIES: ribbon-helix-helix domain-containing protein [unclassified Halomonas]PKG50241.1 DNA-binding protein [Halomonas sp. MES3-P3E]|tara:strand:- start:9779 stop:10063 length:285 start_codon:yes stop_codon:yes gene_type:complete